MKKIHRRITRSLKDGSYIRNLKRIYDSQSLESLGLWGTEPTLTLDIIRSQIPKFVEAFPKLKTISFSTCGLFVESLERFIRVLNGYNIGVDIQISVDGPAFITDKNRAVGVAKKVPENFSRLLSSIQDVKTKVSFRWKTTLTIENLQEINADTSKIDKYWEYFEDLYKRFSKINQNERITLYARESLPTLAVPGRYTSKDGRIFAQFLRNLHRKGHKTAYTFRLKRILNFWDELGIKKSMFTCSGGDSNTGIGKNLHICHRSFYLDEDEYVDSILQQKGIENWDVSYFERGMINLLRDFYIVDPSDKADLSRFFYTMRSYHDFWKLQIGYTRAMMIELASVNQVNKEYLENEELSVLFTLFAASALSCPMEQLLNTGVIHFMPSSLLRLFGNGAFKELLNDTTRRK